MVIVTRRMLVDESQEMKRALGERGLACEVDCCFEPSSQCVSFRISEAVGGVVAVGRLSYEIAGDSDAIGIVADCAVAEMRGLPDA